VLEITGLSGIWCGLSRPRAFKLLPRLGWLIASGCSGCCPGADLDLRAVAPVGSSLLRATPKLGYLIDVSSDWAWPPAGLFTPGVFGKDVA
jgi:hypothetical protein